MVDLSGVLLDPNGQQSSKRAIGIAAFGCLCLCGVAAVFNHPVPDIIVTTYREIIEVALLATTADHWAPNTGGGKP